MDLLRTFLETAFCYYPLKHQNDDGRMPLDEKKYVESVKQKHTELSDDQIRLMFKLYRDDWSKNAAHTHIFNVLKPFVQSVLCDDSGEPKVRLEHLFRWRQLSHIIGEQLMVCAFWALRDVYKEPTKRLDWPAVLKTDEIDYMIQPSQGMSELHHHLKASTDVFGISWICLMNHVTKRQREFRLICSNAENAADLYNDYVEAVAIRIILSNYVLSRDLPTIQLGKVRIDARFGNLDELKSHIHRLANYRKCQYDYLQEHYGYRGNIHVLESERFLLYSVLKRIYEGDDRGDIINMLWRYVVIKNKVRACMVQINENVGFANFSEYESRKEVFLQRFESYSRLLRSLPIAEAVDQHNVSYIESRITPKQRETELYKHLMETVKLIELQMGEIHRREQSHYRLIYHFIKKKEDNSKVEGVLPRNYYVRKEVKRQAVSIKNMLSRHEKARQIVVGIDAANSEFYCRPEVFAQAYRYLRITGLKFTFHVGEDFYDITDGLRAIDEALLFLQLQRGDRMGHCLALAMDANRFYNERNGLLPIPKQVLLDNLVWLFFKAKKYNLIIPPSVELMIKEYFCMLAEMYQDGDKQCDMTEFYHMMMLRGDAPLVKDNYSMGLLIDDWKAYDLDMREEQRRMRQSDNVKALFYKYHMSPRVRDEGEKVLEFKVSQEYVTLIQKLQEKMLDDLESREIAIECCPSSNFKIGGLGRFENHPIFRMCQIEPDGCHHLPVTINTDDLGIFMTSIDNEYALLLLALLKTKDKDGKPKYSKYHIRKWIEMLQQNGRRYAFYKEKKS